MTFSYRSPKRTREYPPADKIARRRRQIGEKAWAKQLPGNLMPPAVSLRRKNPPLTAVAAAQPHRWKNSRSYPSTTWSRRKSWKITRPWRNTRRICGRRTQRRRRNVCWRKRKTGRMWSSGSSHSSRLRRMSTSAAGRSQSSSVICSATVISARQVFPFFALVFNVTLLS